MELENTVSISQGALTPSHKLTVCEGFEITFGKMYKKPSAWSRFWMRALLGWKIEDLK